MEQVAPSGPAYQAGTMAGNPASMSAGLACLEVLAEDGIYEELDRLGAILEKGMLDAAEKHGIDISVNRLKGALSLYFGKEKVTDYAGAEASDGEKFGQFFQLMLAQGINLAPSKYEAWFITTAHSEKDIHYAVTCIDHAFAQMA